MFILRHAIIVADGLIVVNLDGRVNFIVNQDLHQLILD